MGISRQTVLEFVAGDKQAIEKVYLEYKNLMFFVIANYVSSKSDIDDILSESFMKGMEKVKDVDQPSKLKAYLTTIAKNTALDFLKKNKPIPCSDVIDDIYGENDKTNDFLSLIEPLLTNKETIVVYYKIYFSYTWTEIAEETGISESTARRLYDSAKAKLKKGLVV